MSSGGPGGTARRGEGLLAETSLRAGRFGFVELRTDELATSATALDKVELCGRHINVGRPKVRCCCAQRAACVPASWRTQICYLCQGIQVPLLASGCVAGEGWLHAMPLCAPCVSSC